jgi:hypothetical protein
VDSEPVSDVVERLRRLLAGSAASSRSWSLSVVIMSSSSLVSSSPAVRRPRLRDEVEDGIEDVGVGTGVGAVFVRAFLRCLLVDCFALALDLVLVLVLAVGTLAVRDDEECPGSEPIVAVVETLLSEECVEVSLVVDPMVAIVEVLRSAVEVGTMLLDAVVEVVMDSSMLAIAYVLQSGLGRADEDIEEEEGKVVGRRATGVLVSDALAPECPPCTSGEPLVPVPGPDEDEAVPVPVPRG